MPSSTRFSVSEGDAPESPRQGPLDDSDFEDLYDTRRAGRATMKQYWLGKKLFDQMLAMRVYSQNAITETSDELDVMPLSRFPRVYTDDQSGNLSANIRELPVS